MLTTLNDVGSVAARVVAETTPANAVGVSTPELHLFLHFCISTMSPAATTVNTDSTDSTDTTATANTTYGHSQAAPGTSTFDTTANQRNSRRTERSSKEPLCFNFFL